MHFWYSVSGILPYILCTSGEHVVVKHKILSPLCSFKIIPSLVWDKLRCLFLWFHSLIQTTEFCLWAIPRRKELGLEGIVTTFCCYIVLLFLVSHCLPVEGMWFMELSVSTGGICCQHISKYLLLDTNSSVNVMAKARKKNGSQVIPKRPLL